LKKKNKKNQNNSYFCFMPFEKKPEPKPTKWEVVFEDEETISIWRYNSKKNPFGPVDVEYKYKRGYVHPGSKKKSIRDLINKNQDESL